MEEGFCTLRDDETTYKKALVVWYKLRKCARCGNKFQLMNSFGNWDCRYHSQSTEFRTDKKQFVDGYFAFKCCDQIQYPTQRSRFANVFGDYVSSNENKKRTRRTYCLHTVKRNTEKPKKMKMSMPSGCVRADCRESLAMWTDADDIDIRNIAALLPSMSNIEDRPAFQHATEQGVISRYEKKKKDDTTTTT